jgi:hypothetical protein
MIILGSQVPIDPMEYLYTLPACALGHHYKTFQWFALVCSVPTEVSWEVSVQITKGPSCAMWLSGESTPLPTRSQPDRSIGSPLYPLHRLVRQTSLYHILCQAHGCTAFMGGHSRNRSLDLGMMTNHMLLESTKNSPELLESTEHSSKPVTPNPYSSC